MSAKVCVCVCVCVGVGVHSILVCCVRCGVCTSRSRMLLSSCCRSASSLARSRSHFSFCSAHSFSRCCCFCSSSAFTFASNSFSTVIDTCFNVSFFLYRGNMLWIISAMCTILRRFIAGVCTAVLGSAAVHELGELGESASPRVQSILHCRKLVRR